MKRIILGVLDVSIFIPCMMLGSYGTKSFISIAHLIVFLILMAVEFKIKQRLSKQSI